MLETGQSLVTILNKLIEEQNPKEIHVDDRIAILERFAILKEHLPENCHLWVASLYKKLNEKIILYLV